MNIYDCFMYFDEDLLLELRLNSLDKFVKKFAGKTAKQFQNFWRKMVFSGKGKMPQAFASEADLAAFVAANPGSIGYVAKGAAIDGAKQIKVEWRL